MSEPILADGWEALGLPSPQDSGYSYKVDAGLLRTPFEVARKRQLRKHRSWLRTFTLSFNLTHEELSVAEAALTVGGYSWFTMKLVSGGGNLVDHLVRLIEPWAVSAISGNYYSLSITLEAKSPLTIRIFGPLYGTGYEDILAVHGYLPYYGEEYYTYLNEGLIKAVAVDSAGMYVPYSQISGTFVGEIGPRDWVTYKEGDCLLYDEYYENCLIESFLSIDLANWYSNDSGTLRIDVSSASGYGRKELTVGPYDIP